MVAITRTQRNKSMVLTHKRKSYSFNRKNLLDCIKAEYKFKFKLSINLP